MNFISSIFKILIITSNMNRLILLKKLKVKIIFSKNIFILYLNDKINKQLKELMKKLKK